MGRPFPEVACLDIFKYISPRSLCDFWPDYLLPGGHEMDGTQTRSLHQSCMKSSRLKRARPQSGGMDVKRLTMWWEANMQADRGEVRRRGGCGERGCVTEATWVVGHTDEL